VHTDPTDVIAADLALAGVQAGAADRQAIIDTRLSDDRQQRVARAITNKLTRCGHAKRLDLRRACDSSIRDDFDPVFELFLDKGFIVGSGAGDGRADEYKLAPQGS
jgi:hypothetical protein